MPSLVNYRDELIFLTGGFTTGIGNLKKVKVYDIKSNSWSNAAPLNVARNYHSCCSLANYIYVVCGGYFTVQRFHNVAQTTIKREGHRFFERLDVEAFKSNAKAAKWQILGLNFPFSRDCALVGPVSKNEFFILGGHKKT